MTPPLPHQNPPPNPAEAAQLSAPDMAQIYAMLAAMNEEIKATTREIKNNTNKMDGISRKMEVNTGGVRGEVKEVRGRCRIWVQACRTGLKN